MSVSKSMAAYIKAAKEAMYKPESVFEKLAREKRGGLIISQIRPDKGGPTLGAMGHKTLHKRSGKDKFDYQRAYAMG